jgi:hypothetical protein
MSRLVNPLDLTFVLPMRIKKDAGGKQRRDGWIHDILTDSGWNEPDPLDRGAGDDAHGFVYAEMAYFHPHVRTFLYGSKAPKAKAAEPVSEPETRLYRHAQSPKELEVEYKGWTGRFEIRAVDLHHMRPDALLLSVRLAATDSVPWARALDAISLIRTVSFQHYLRKEEETADGKKITGWLGAEQDFLGRLHFGGKSDESAEKATDRKGEMKIAIDNRKPALIDVWRKLLEPLQKNGLEVELLGDHRMAMTVFAGVPDPENITDDEWFALAQADTADYPTYATAFLNDELRKAAYDRWWDLSKGKKHRYLAGPLTFLSVTEWPKNEPPCTDRMRWTWRDRMRETWRRQQFHIFLLAHYQRAALLILEQRIAELTAKIRPQAGIRLDDDITLQFEELQGDIALFSSGHWFPEVSPQIQGQELYQLLRRHLCLDSLYKSVVEDRTLLGDWVEAKESNDRDRWLQSINNKYLPLVLIVTALGATIVLDPLRALLALGLTRIGCTKSKDSLTVGAIVAAVMAIVIWLLWFCFARVKRTKK